MIEPSDNSQSSSEIIHATCVSLNDRGLLITGPSGSGKSSLALKMLACGAVLVADDRCILSVEANSLVATPHENIAGMIEARGVGILNAAYQQQARVEIILDLGEIETARLPEPRWRKIMGIELPLYYKPTKGPLAAAMIQLLKAGRYA